MESNQNKKKQSFFKRLKNKYRLVVYNDMDYQPVFQVKYTRLVFISAWITSFVLFIAIIYTAIAYTPIKELIPGYPKTSLKNTFIENTRLLDSLEMELLLRDQYFMTLQSIVTGKEPVHLDRFTETETRGENYEFASLVSDSLFYRPGEESEPFVYSITDDKKINANISSLHYFPPLKGIVTNKFNAMENHYGIDIVASSNEVVKSILPGTVTLAAWTLETGHIIQVQHESNLVSVYKHNAELLKRVGNRVEAGEPIAIVGNSGELTTGPHLHFEMWYNGTPINPEDFIIF